ncbi:PucR family transcriptional regulator [Caballeronia sp. DA-9]|uniref:PucR family transcriptional regulator n=1 Tax=Caballeronia sp. DA-9 TaxID=3436237 RepID=UPI003F670FF1
MIASVPAISPLLRELTEQLSSDRSSVIDRMYATLINIEGYRDLDLAVKLDIRDSIGWSAKLWFESILSGAPPSEEELQVFQAFGQRRVHQGVSLQTILQAFRQGTRELWCLYIESADKSNELRDELLFRISPYLMDYFDVMAQISARSYLDEQYRHTRWRESLRYQLNTIVMNYPEDSDGFNRTAAALGLDASAPRIALAVEVGPIDNNSPTFDNELDRIVAAIGRRLKVLSNDLLNTWYRGRLLVWVPCTVGNPINENDRRIARDIVSAAPLSPEIMAIGIGLMGVGAAGWAASANEAAHALSFGRAHAGEDRVRLYSDIVIEESVRGTSNALRYIVSLLEQLSSEPDLLLTLQTYFEQAQRRKATASVLDIHPNTLNYRLERIEKLLGADLDDAGWLAKLDVAIKLRGERSL